MEHREKPPPARAYHPQGLHVALSEAFASPRACKEKDSVLGMQLAFSCCRRNTMNGRPIAWNQDRKMLRLVAVDDLLGPASGEQQSLSESVLSVTLLVVGTLLFSLLSI
jgi:hypothetical protein